MFASIDLGTLLIDEFLDLLIEVLSPSHQGVAPLFPQYAQILVLVTVQRHLQSVSHGHATHGYVQYRLTDDWQGSGILYRLHANLYPTLLSLSKLIDAT